MNAPIDSSAAGQANTSADTKGPKVSVCIATCNHRDYIEQCIQSVLDQSRDTRLEILVGDDCSDDGTSEVVRAIAARHPGEVFHHRHEPRLGAFENTRFLLRLTRGSLIACLDGDDYWRKDKLRRQLRLMDDDPACSAVYTNAVTVREDGQCIGLFNDVGDCIFDVDGLIERGNFLNYSSMLFRAQSIASILAEARPILDYRVHLIHAGFGPVRHMRQPLTAYRVNSNGSMVNSKSERVREMYWEALTSAPSLGVSDRSLALGMADLLRRVVFRSLRTRDGALLKRWSSRVLDASPFGRMRTLGLVAASIARISWRTGLGLFRRKPGGGRLKILYRR